MPKITMKQFREAGVRPVEIAEACGVTRSSVYLWNTRGVPDCHTYRLYCLLHTRRKKVWALEAQAERYLCKLESEEM